MTARRDDTVTFTGPFPTGHGGVILTLSTRCAVGSVHVHEMKFHATPIAWRLSDPQITEYIFDGMYSQLYAAVTACVGV